MRLLLRCFFWMSLTFATALGAHAEEALRLGVAPHSSARVIIEMYQPLRQHLEKALGLPVMVITAPDFNEFARRGLAGQYDLAVTTGHQARLLQLDAGYLPLLTYVADFRAVALVKGNSHFEKPADLQQGRALGLSGTSLVTLWGQRWLQENQLKLPIEHVSASDSVARLLLDGRAEVGFMSLANYQHLPAALQSQLRFIGFSQPMAGRVYLLNPAQQARKAQIEAALWSFARSPAGEEYFKTHQLDGYRALKPGELEAMDPFANEVRSFLRSHGPAS